MTETVEAWTDGSCRGNPGRGGYAAVLRKGKHERVLTGGEPLTTNNRMELMGAIVALEALKRPVAIVLHSDSIYVVKGATIWHEAWKRRGWKKVANRDLWERLLRAAEPHDVKWVWVRGHAGDPDNERVDQLATAAADAQGGPV